jgi:hypothetical protein
MATIAYEELQTENLITFSFDSITSNFKNIDTFMRNFMNFQRSTTYVIKEVIDMEKMQKAAALDLSNFKTSTASNFSMLNEILDSRGNISKGSTKGLEDDMVEVKKSIKELKVFVTESTRDIGSTLDSK